MLGTQLTPARQEQRPVSAHGTGMGLRMPWELLLATGLRGKLRKSSSTQAVKNNFFLSVSPYCCSTALKAGPAAPLWQGSMGPCSPFQFEATPRGSSCHPTFPVCWLAQHLGGTAWLIPPYTSCSRGIPATAQRLWEFPSRF